MAYVITVANQKGGVGKTTTTSALAGKLSNKGYRVLTIEIDRQGNLTYSSQAETNKPNLDSVLFSEKEIEEAVKNSNQGDFIPAGATLGAADQVLLNEKRKEYKLKDSLEKIKNRYDYIFIDTPPALGLLAINALTASDGVIITSTPTTYSLQGLGQLAQTIKAVKDNTNPKLKIEGIVITRYQGRLNIVKQLMKQLEATAQGMGTKIFESHIRECAALQEAQAFKQNIYEYAPKSNAAHDYDMLISEIFPGV